MSRRTPLAVLAVLVAVAGCDVDLELDPADTPMDTSADQGSDGQILYVPASISPQTEVAAPRWVVPDRPATTSSATAIIPVEEAQREARQIARAAVEDALAWLAATAATAGTQDVPVDQAAAVAGPSPGADEPDDEPEECWDHATQTYRCEYEPVDVMPGTSQTQLFWSADLRRLALFQVLAESGGSGASDVVGKIVRRRDGAVRHVRTLQTREAAEFSDDDEDPRAQRRYAKFSAKLQRDGYIAGETVPLEALDDDGHLTRTGRITEGPLRGARIGLDMGHRQDDVRVWLQRRDGAAKRTLGTVFLAGEECWSLGDDDAKTCEERFRGLSQVWVAPDGKHIVVEVFAMTANCHSTVDQAIVVSPVRGTAR